MRRSDRLHILGIRHHGPGSARGVLAALNSADPAVVLIEGPPDANDIITFAASTAMVPPVAILVHAQDEPANSSFYPFAEFSPEWQAIRWALTKGRPVRFIDLPISIRLAERARSVAAAKAAAEGAPETTNAPEADDGDPAATAMDPASETDTAPAAPAADPQLIRIRRDPLAYLAEIAGYDDSEAWWNALVEQGSHGPEIFDALEVAIGALREVLDVQMPWGSDAALMEQQREAHMRLAIADALTEVDGSVAVVCGAWHMPALRQPTSAKVDRGLIKGLTKIKVTATWVPWTDTRLAAATGYSAGVVSPGWYHHLWTEMNPNGADRTRLPLAPIDFASRWQASVAELLRQNGRPASTASIIEAARLATSLAALRELALPGLEEMREASLATLCEGESAPLRIIEQQLVIGQRVGEIDDGVPQMPLAADLALWQRKLKLKPEALDTDLALDLRSETGLARSLLLHRLGLINVPWGKAQGVGTSRGTFRENWRLRWEPEFSVRLAEALVYGTTVEQASGNAAIAAAERAPSLEELSRIVRGCLDAGLEQAATTGIGLLQRRAATSNDIAALAAAIPPLASILRYGTAREIPIDALRLLVRSLSEVVCAGLVYACRNLQSDAAEEMRTRLAGLDSALIVIDDTDLTSGWQRSLDQLANDGSAHPMLAGLAVRALHDQSIHDSTTTALQLSRALSPSRDPKTAADWLDGFLGRSGQILLHDHGLRGIIDHWLTTIGEEDFINMLPVMRRSFSTFDRSERRRLLDEIAKSRPAASVSEPSPAADTAVIGSRASGAAPGFVAALPLLLTVLGLPTSRAQETAS